MAAPGGRRFLTRRPFAHRGLHGRGVPENSLAAARAAIALRLGIECDVRLSADGVPHLFHDEDAGRLTGMAGRFAHLAHAAIAALRLAGGEEPPPTLAALLALTGRATPLLIEMKALDRAGAIAPGCRAIARAVGRVGRPVAVMSFDPRIVAWFARHRPDLVRGLVTSRRWRPAPQERLAARLAFRAANPHFIARDVRDLARPLRNGPRHHPALPLLCWTVRGRRDRLAARAHGAQIIFER